MAEGIVVVGLVPVGTTFADEAGETLARGETVDATRAGLLAERAAESRPPGAAARVEAANANPITATTDAAATRAFLIRWSTRAGYAPYLKSRSTKAHTARKHSHDPRS